jgi:4-amino-4-deoxy-L-arabinose transferase-like glycosyltransferase
MKEQGASESTEKAENKESSTINSITAGGEEYITVSSKKDRARKSTILLVVLIGIGLVFLFFMIKKSNPSEASASTVTDEELQIEKAITELTGVKAEMYSRMDEIVKKFYEFSEVEQVDVKELAKNPFQHKMLLMGLNTVKDSKDKEGQAELIYQQLRQQAENMELLSIMQSSGKKCCMIDDKILYEGDSFKSFKISQIGDDYVKLEWSAGQVQSFSGTEVENMEIILRLSD